VTATRFGEADLAPLLASVGPLDEDAMAEARARLDHLTKPPGSLGRLEDLVVWLAGVTGRADATVDRPAIVIAAADHGVARHGVSAYPSTVTAQMVANFLDGGAAISVLARAIGATVTVIDVGVAEPIPKRDLGPAAARLVDARVRPGTADMANGPAMRRADAVAAIEAGIDVAGDVIAAGAQVVAVGEMGIGNTTAAAAITAVLTGEPVERVTGRGTGIADEALVNKVAVIKKALKGNRPDAADPLDVLASVGGLEIAALVGVIARCAAAGVPVVLDGYITAAAALVATRLSPAIGSRLLAAHRSPEPGHAIALRELGLQPILALDLRLGDATGAALAVTLLATACRLRDEMATFASAAVSGPVEAVAAHSPPSR
jgi:nicotinate-nucleotide--dimethylbenzimidazole phosphoribosyltransferase